MGTVSGRIGGALGGYNLECSQTGNIFRGRLGGSITGNDINLEMSPEGNQLWGRVALL